jgi:hypothetical protein
MVNDKGKYLRPSMLYANQQTSIDVYEEMYKDWVERDYYSMDFRLKYGFKDRKWKDQAVEILKQSNRVTPEQVRRFKELLHDKGRVRQRRKRTKEPPDPTKAWAQQEREDFGARLRESAETIADECYRETRGPYRQTSEDQRLHIHRLLDEMKYMILNIPDEKRTIAREVQYGAVDMVERTMRSIWDWTKYDPYPDKFDFSEPSSDSEIIQYQKRQKSKDSLTPGYEGTQDTTTSSSSSSNDDDDEDDDIEMLTFPVVNFDEFVETYSSSKRKRQEEAPPKKRERGRPLKRLKKLHRSNSI